MAEAAVGTPPMAADGAGSVFELPSLGADMDIGTLLEWYVAPGDSVDRGDVVALVGTDKADVDVEIWRSGMVDELLVETGIEIEVGTPILRLAPTPTPSPAPVPTSPSVRPVPAAMPPRTEAATASPVAAVRSPSPTRLAEPEMNDGTIVAASPLARVAAADAGVDLRAVVGSGPGGAVLARDVERHLTNRPDQARPPASSDDRNASMRRAIAAKMATANRDIPHYYLEHDVDLGFARAWLEARNAERSIADRVLPAALVLSAVAAATAETPGLNGYWINDRFEPASGVDLAVVVSLRAGGLVTPKIASADQLSIDEMMAALTEVVTAARRGALRSSWLSGAGLTVSSLGDRGADRLSGVVFPPQVALVGAGGIRQRPWVVDSAVEPRPIMTLSLAADHRASDGIVGSRFLTSIADRLENPEE